MQILLVVEGSAWWRHNLNGRVTLERCTAVNTPRES
jgi:hypothetical protein